MAREPRKPRIRCRRIIERPRLIRALDRSDARVRMLVADSGWGKTTLAEQWAAREGCRVAWYRARRSAADVSVVARGLVAAADEIVPGAGSRLLQRLSVTADPEREATLLAEMLAEDLEDWPSDGWIVIDDYQHLAASTASEAFVHTVVSRSTVQLLVAGTGRPSWVTARDMLRGSVLELPETAFAMTAEEVSLVMGGGRPGLASGLLALAHGWPAVIGLAAMTPGAREPDAEQPLILYDFFAEELFSALEPSVRRGLTILAEMPLIDGDLAAVILGPERANQICREALSLGILDERAGYLEFHTLAADFLERHARWNTSGRESELVAHAGNHYRGRGELDAAFDLADRVGASTDVNRLVSDSMDDLLDRARLPTLEHWVTRARAHVGETPAVRLAQAEIALRQGRHLAAQALAERVCSSADEQVAFRANLIGAKAAHVGMREGDALTLFKRAHLLASSEQEQRQAKWGELTAAIELELDLSHELLSELEASAGSRLDPTEAVQTATKRLLIGLRFGGIRSLTEAKRVAGLVSTVSDPVLRCSFGSMFSCTLTLAVEYERALEVATEMIRDAAQYRVDFAMPYGFLMRGSALAGLRRFEEAHEALRESLMHAVRCADPFGQQAVYSGRIRAYLHEGRIAEACALEPPDLGDSLPGMRGEVWASRGLALACMGRLAEARQLSEEHRETRAVEANVLALCIRAISALKARDPHVAQALRRLVQGAYSAGAPDLLVTAYRASPELLASILRDPETAEVSGYVVARASDQALAESVGVDVLEAMDPVSSLSPREHEVYTFLCEGLPNSEIAERLFISNETVKVHVRHVFDKLGIRSRTALALHAASLRFHANPAAAAIDSVEAASDVDG